ncbi:MAG: AAA family ATPase [Clostridium sp.]|uniref:AAA family ATPase n=1 Tax=Clostridium sp. TaxID=1506 RepID=UPI002A8BB004|nr:AAA family ATPase [Clostridium sp.]MDY5097854.1 AAA family ATPase [Clostridium sp.]
MKRKLTSKEVIFQFDFKGEDMDLSKDYVLHEYKDVYKEIEEIVLQDKKGDLNIYLVDDFSKDKINSLVAKIENMLKSKNSPKDICYVIYDNEKAPKVLILKNGMAKKLKESLEFVKDEMYKLILKFYSTSAANDKDIIMEELNKKRSDLIEFLVEKAKDEGFDIKATAQGFAFMPLKEEGEAMTTKEYDGLDMLLKEEILGKVSKLKTSAQDILESIREMEDKYLDKVKVIMKAYLGDKSKDIKETCYKDLNGDDTSMNYLEFVINSIIDSTSENFSGEIEDDADVIDKIIEKFIINIIADNSNVDHPRVIFESNPTVSNLMGKIEYETQSGAYATSPSLIYGGSLVRANEGVLIVRVTDILNNGGAYEYLNKAIFNKKISYDFYRSYLEILSLSTLDIEEIPFDTKIIMVGDFEVYNILSEYDSNFKSNFPIHLESNPVVKICKEDMECIRIRLNTIVKDNNLLPITQSGFKEIVKYLCRKSENRDKIYFNDEDIVRLLQRCCIKAKISGKNQIDEASIQKITEAKSIFEIENLDMYKEGKILINVDGIRSGSVNGLSVVGTKDISFGKPIRITCVCYKGDGNILDAHKESKLSGKIHEKSLNILKAYINSLYDKYNSLPIDFYLSFEQVYGNLEGDSASVGEVLAVLSALSSIPIKQNIAVTGSINQFGEIQPVGGINEKIEGFFNLCDSISKVNGKGVLIPASNVSDIILNHSIEEAVREGRFSIYTMNTIEDAVETLMEDMNWGRFMEISTNEIKRFVGKKK